MILVIGPQTPVFVQPAECSFHDPELGKQVQKRWLCTYRGSCYKMTDAQIAGYVRAHIRY